MTPNNKPSGHELTDVKRVGANFLGGARYQMAPVSGDIAAVLHFELSLPLTSNKPLAAPTLFALTKLWKALRQLLTLMGEVRQ